MKNGPFCHHEQRLPVLRLNCVYCWLPYIFASKREWRDDICSNLAKGYSNLIRNVQFYKFTKLYCGNHSWKIQFWKCNKQNPKWVDNTLLRISSVIEAREQKLYAHKAVRMKPLCSESQTVLSGWPGFWPLQLLCPQPEPLLSVLRLYLYFPFNSPSLPHSPWDTVPLSLGQWYLNFSYSTCEWPGILD